MKVLDLIKRLEKEDKNFEVRLLIDGQEKEITDIKQWRHSEPVYIYIMSNQGE